MRRHRKGLLLYGSSTRLQVLIASFFAPVPAMDRYKKFFVNYDITKRRSYK